MCRVTGTDTEVLRLTLAWSDPCMQPAEQRIQELRRGRTPLRTSEDSFPIGELRYDPPRNHGFTSSGRSELGNARIHIFSSHHQPREVYQRPRIFLNTMRPGPNATGFPVSRYRAPILPTAQLPSMSIPKMTD